MRDPRRACVRAFFPPPSLLWAVGQGVDSFARMDVSDMERRAAEAERRLAELEAHLAALTKLGGGAPAGASTAASAADAVSPAHPLPCRACAFFCVCVSTLTRPLRLLPLRR